MANIKNPFIIVGGGSADLSALEAVTIRLETAVGPYPAEVI